MKKEKREEEESMSAEGYTTAERLQDASHMVLHELKTSIVMRKAFDGGRQA